MSAEQARNGIAHLADSDQAGVFHALAEPVEIAAGVPGLRRAADADKRRERAVRAAHRALDPNGLSIRYLQLDFGDVYRREVLVGHAQQEVPAVAVADLPHGTVGVPGRFATGGHNSLGERADGGNAVPEVNAAASLGMPPGRIRNRTHVGRGVQRIEHEVWLPSERVGERRNHQGSLGSQRLQQRVHHRFGAACNVSQAAQGAMHHDQTATRDAEAGEVANERCAVKRLAARPDAQAAVFIQSQPAQIRHDALLLGLV